MKKLCLLAILLAVLHVAFAQKVTVSGIVMDANSGEQITGAYIILTDTVNPSNPLGCVSNKAGFYSVSVYPGAYLLKVSFMGYKEYSEMIQMEGNRSMNIALEPAAILTEEVVVTGQQGDHNVSSVDVGKVDLQIQAIKKLPAFLGEADILKAVQLLPGFSSGSEGNSGLYVRGGAADQNLVLLDEATMYNASHLFGFFSVFNTDAIRNVEVYKSGIPSYYGGRLSSIIDVSQKEGNMKKYEFDGSIGLLFSKFTLQGPIKKDKCSFIISGRRTYVDLLIQPFLPKKHQMKGLKFYFYDLNAKFNVVINDKHRLYFGGYYGRDCYGFKSRSDKLKVNFLWANAMASARWNYIISPKLFLNTFFTFSHYDFSTMMSMDVYKFELKSGLEEYAVKSELTYLPSPKHNLRFGVHYIYHVMRPNDYDVEAGAQINLSLPKTTPLYAHELGIYAADEWDIAKWLKVNIGLRYSHFEHVGSFTRYILDDRNMVIDSVVYRPGQRVSQYNRLEPRLNMCFRVAEYTSIKASATLNYQYLHQIPMSTISLPVDVWMPSTDLLKPQACVQVSLGVYQNFYKNMFEAYVDGYYKKMYNLAEYKDGLAFNSLMINPDQMYTFGDGYSTGVEFFFKKSKGRFTGFVGYTLSYTKRHFDELNGGEPFYAKYDRRHDVSINLSYEILRNKLTVSLVWVYATGNAMTVPLGFYEFNGSMVQEYSKRNEYRMGPYHRLDFSLDWFIAKRRHFETSLNFSIYNVYNRKNPFFIFYETNTNVDLSNRVYEMETKAYQMSLVPIMPSITWNFKIK